MRAIVFAAFMGLISTAAFADRATTSTTYIIAPPVTPTCIGSTCGFISAVMGRQPNMSTSPTACVQDADCTVIVDRCGYKSAVNMAHQALEQSRLNADTRACSSIDSRGVLESRCEGSTCVVTLAPP